MGLDKQAARLVPKSKSAVAWSAGERRSSPVPEAPPSEDRHPNWTRFLGGCDGGPVEDQVNDIAIVAVGAVGCGEAHIYIDTDALPHLRWSATSSLSPSSTLPLGIPTTRLAQPSSVAA